MGVLTARGPDAVEEHGLAEEYMFWLGKLGVDASAARSGSEIVTQQGRYSLAENHHLTQGGNLAENLDLMEEMRLAELLQHHLRL